MKLVSYCFSLSFVFFLVLPYKSACSITQVNDVIYNGFEQFLGTIHTYRCDQLRGGLSKNTQYVCSVNDNKYVVRILKESLSIRQGEVNNHLVAARHTIAPTIHYYDEDEYSFVIMDFIDGQTLLFEHANRCDVLDLIVRTMKAIAQFDDTVSSVRTIDLRALMACYYDKIQAYADVTLHSLIANGLRIFEVVYQSIENEYRPLVFSHNDLHPRNIFYLQNDMVIIDWETGALNYELYDVANYSVYACLHEADEYYLLTQYLECFPSDDNLEYFKKVKLLVKVFNAFGFLICLDHMPDTSDMELVKDFSYYARIFAQDANANDPEFLYELAMSLLQEFFEDFEQIEHDK